jgi:hypothetical protein
LGAVYKRRHARQLLLAEIGERGQARLCATRVRLSGDGDLRAAAVARDYLERAGLQLMDAHEASARSDDEESRGLAVEIADSGALRALAGRPELEEAAAALVGAFAAVEAIKGALDLAHPATLPAGVSLHGEERA